MRELKIGCSPEIRDLFHYERDTVDIRSCEAVDLSAAVIADDDTESIKKLYNTMFGIPIFVVSKDRRKTPEELEMIIYRWIYLPEADCDMISNEINIAAGHYELRMLPPFFERLEEYVGRKNVQFNCPGHQGGQYFRKHPAGKFMYDYFGEKVFTSDLCNADVELGDLLIHDGPAADALKNATRVFNSDSTYFVLNGTSTSNMIVGKALVTPGDLVLFDRNNHKSLYDSTLIQSGGIPVYLETTRNPFGFIGGIGNHCFEEDYIRAEIAKVAPERAQEPRPFRLAAIQLGTYDGTIANARRIVDKIGHLCDYILFDSAWVGYEQFIPIMKDCSPLLLELGPDDPGIFVTQSVHKQQAGFSQASYIHKKDSHIKGQNRYMDDKRFNTVYRAHSSTSPFYPLYASMDVNARMQDGKAGEKLWDDCIRLGIEARKRIFDECRFIRPFVPPQVDGKPWQEYDTDEISSSRRFFEFEPDESWHAFEGYGPKQYFIDPNKLLLTTPGIDAGTGEYEDFGIPASILAAFLRDNGIICEKNDFNSILFLMTPAEDNAKFDVLISKLTLFERYVESNTPVNVVLPLLYTNNQDRYRGVGIRDLCDEMHRFYKTNNAKQLQKRMFQRDYLPEQEFLPSEANISLLKNDAKLVKIEDIEGEIALEGALPYPPGIYCVVPGERWNSTVRDYFIILQEGINRFPGFAPELHGVYLEKEDGRTVAYAFVKK